MPRTRRFIRPKRTYELIIRAYEGLPFPPTEVMRLLFESALARTQRDCKVTLCHILVMSNHVHILLVVESAKQCVAFYQEFQKKITDGIKRLTGRTRLRLWEGDAIVAEILDPEKMVDRIAYLYANPARADLVKTIGEYPGLSSWKAFLESNSILTSVTKSAPWLRLSEIKKLPSLAISSSQDLEACLRLRNRSKETHAFNYYPNAWMQTFGITEEREVRAYQRRILAKLKEKEDAAAKIRLETGKSCIGRKSLVREPIFKTHTPAKRKQRIFVFSSIKKLRDQYISAVKRFCQKCAKCYERLRRGEDGITWPSGAFIPAVAPP